MHLDMARPFSAARARNEGFERLCDIMPHCEFVQFVDGDCELESGWLDSAWRLLDEHPQIAVVCGRRRERYPQASVYNMLCDAEWNTPVGEAAACGGDALMRASAFREVGGFDSSVIAGEEPELCNRLRQAGHIVWRLDAPMTVHDAAMFSFRQSWLRSVRCGFGYAQIWNKTRYQHSTLYGREVGRAIFWAVGVPVLALGMTLINPGFALVAPGAYAAQIVRLAARDGIMRAISWQAALLNVAGKFAELTGMLRFAIQRVAKADAGAIYYK